MALTAVVTGDTVLAADLNQYKDVLEGAAVSTWLLRADTATNIQLKLADAGGTYKLLVLDSTGATVGSIDSDGNMTLTGSFTPGTLTMPSSVAPSQTTAGGMVWDTVTKRPTIGNGASTLPIGPRYKYATAAQNFATTTLTDVLATSGNIAFAVAANTDYLFRFQINISAVGTASSGGIKYAFTGPASPTAVQVMGTYSRDKIVSDAPTGDSGAVTYDAPVSTTVTFGTAFLAENASNGNTAAGIQQGITDFTLLLRNGANAGTVTLQAAQNTAAGTTTITGVIASVEVVTVP